MGQQSKIEWCDHTANLWWGCTAVHEGCKNCYAETLANRWGNDIWGNDKPRKEVKSVWRELEKMQVNAKKTGEIHRVFVGSMMDIFEKPMPLVDSKGEYVFYEKQSMQGAYEIELNTGHLRNAFFSSIDEGYYPNLMFLLLTKRPSNINKYIPESWKENPPTNVMFGTSPVNQETFNKLVGQLLEVKGKRFLSVEPQVGMIDNISLLGIHWVIQGGESGHKKREFNLDWAYKMKSICQTQKVPYFFKQIDKVQEIPTDLLIREFPHFAGC